MRFNGRTAVAVLSAAAVMAVGAGSAAAGTISPGGSFSAASTSNVSVRIPALANTTCPISLSGSLATSYGTLPANVGSLTSFTSSGCLGGITLNATSVPDTLELSSVGGGSAAVTAKSVTLEVTLGLIRCTATGDIPFTFTNGSTTLTSAATTLAGGCGGIQLGAGSYTLSAAQTF